MGHTVQVPWVGETLYEFEFDLEALELLVGILCQDGLSC